MPPIPVYTNSPIKATTPTKTTPETSDRPSTTATYPQASPGAPAVPSTTGVARLPAVQQPPPTPTTTTDIAVHDGPPPPQPGAVPVPFASSRSTASGRTSDTVPPPPPRAGDTATLGREGTRMNITQMPPHFSTPAPSSNRGPTSSTLTTGAGNMPPAATSTYAAPTKTSALPRPVQLPPHPQSSPYETGSGGVGSLPAATDDAYRRPSLEHPPGYQQNPYAADLTPAQRAAQEQAETRESIGGGLPLGGILPGGVLPGGGEGGVWDQAKGLLEKVGSGLSEVEKDVWKRFSGQGK